MAERRQPGDRAIRIYPKAFLWATMPLDDRATGFYMELLVHSDSQSEIPLAAARALGDSRYLFKRYVRDLSSKHVGLVEHDGRCLHLAQWAAASHRWRFFGRANDVEPVAAVSRIVVSSPRVSLAPTLRAYIVARDGSRCGICGGIVADGEALDIDHIVPVSLGGTDDPENLQVAHASCNRSKGARILGGAE